MLLRRCAVILAVAVFAIASASLITTIRVNGSGRLVNAEGRYGYFTVDASKSTTNGRSSLRGAFDFHVPGPNTSDSLRVHLNFLDGMTVTENRGSIGGPGVLRIQHGAEVRYYEGRVYFQASSNRHAREDGPFDAASVHFVPAVQTNPSFHMEGLVREGDVEVSTHLSY